MKTPDQLTADQKFCIAMLAEWMGGSHHLPKVQQWGPGVAINFSGALSTYDFDHLTRLVILAHRDAVRIEIGASGPRMVRIIAHRRQHGDRKSLTMSEYHPDLGGLRKLAANLDVPAARPVPAAAADLDLSRVGGTPTTADTEADAKASLRHARNKILTHTAHAQNAVSAFVDHDMTYEKGLSVGRAQGLVEAYNLCFPDAASVHLLRENPKMTGAAQQAGVQIPRPWATT